MNYWHMMKDKDKSKTTKSPKAVRAGRRPHELQRQMRDALKRLTDARADVVVAEVTLVHQNRGSLG